MLNNNSKERNVISRNVRGLALASKCRTLFIWFQKQKADVVFIQETHCTNNKLNVFINCWNGPFYYDIIDGTFSFSFRFILPKLSETQGNFIIPNKKTMNARLLIE